MIEVEVIGRQPVPGAAALGLSLDRAAEAVRFTVTKPRAGVFDAPGLSMAVSWLSPLGHGGMEAIEREAQGDALVYTWTPPVEALLSRGELRAELRGSLAGDMVWHSLPLALFIDRSLEDERQTAVIVPKYKEISLAVDTLPAGSPATGSVVHDAERIAFSISVPVQKGDTGPEGSRGLTGERGPQGLMGETGPKGDRGFTGETGPQGAIGAQGIKGDQGLKGDKGDQGNTGAKGDTGATGAKGDKGDTGPAGPITNLDVVASRFGFAQDGVLIAINPAPGSKVRVTASATTTLTYNGSTIAVTANTPVEITAIAGFYTLSVPTGTLRAEYNRDSMDVLTQLAAPVTATGPIAKVAGLIGDLPLALTARLVATQAGSGDPSPDNVRAIVGKAAASLTRCGHNLFNQAQAPAFNLNSNITNASDWLRITSTIAGAISAIYARYTLPSALTGQTITVTPTWINSAANIGYATLLWINPATGNGAGGTSYAMTVPGVSTTITVPPPPDAVPNALLSIVLYANKSGGTVAVGDYTEFRVMMRLGTTGAPFEPYYGIAKAVTLPETVYGLMGNPVIADLGQGIATIGTAYKKYAGTEAWQNFVPYNGTSLQYFCFQVVTAGIVSTANASVLCSHLPTVTDVAKATGNTSGIQTSSSSVYVKIPRTLLNVTLPEGYDSQAGFDASGVVTNAWKAYLAGQLAAGKPLEVVYTLGTPHTLAIMPTSIQALAGTNTAYTDGGGDTTITGRQGAQGMADRLAVCEAGLKALTGG